MTEFLYVLALAIVLLAVSGFLKTALNKLKSIEVKLDFFKKGKT